MRIDTCSPLAPSAPPAPAGPLAAATECGESRANVRCQTLYVTDHGTRLGVRQGVVVARRKDETVREVPLARIDRVVVLATSSLSSAFLEECIEREIPVLFMLGRGKAYGSLVPGGIPNPLRLRAQYALVTDEGRRLALATEIVSSKVTAMERRLRAAPPEAESARKSLASLLEELAAATTPASLRGYEGAATKAYYDGFATRIRRPAFAFVRRSRRPPRDPINSLLSFAYTLLFGEMQTALLTHGLDPCPALLHELDRRHPALASDLSEPYRPLVADSFVLTLVNNDRVDEADFESEEGGFHLTNDARRAVLASWESWLRTAAPGRSGGTTPRGLLDQAARRMLGVVLGERERLDLPLALEDAPASTEDPAEREIRV